MIEKLNLHTSARPHPYNIRWLNQSKVLQINSRYLISFSIGKNYQHDLWFDVMHMDFYHVLFGRLWLFDQKVMRNGHFNTCLFLKDDKRITLAPSQLHKKALQKNLEQSDLFLLLLVSPY